MTTLSLSWGKNCQAIKKIKTQRRKRIKKTFFFKFEHIKNVQH